MRLEPGDIFVTKGDSFVSRAIRFFSRTGGESRTQVNHTGLVTVGGNQATAVIVEALTKVRRRTMASYATSLNTEVAVFRPLNVSGKDLETIVARANGYVGRSYGYLKIAAHFGDWCLGGRYFFRRFVSSDRYPICSWVVAQAYSDAGFTFGVDPGAADPDDIWDYCTSNPDKYQVVHPLGLI